MPAPRTIFPATRISASPHWPGIRPAISSPWWKNTACPIHEKKLGQLFCDTSSKEIVTLLADECRQAGAQILTRCPVRAIERGDRFSLATDRGEFRAESLVIASGGLSFPKMGASGFGYDVARQFGLAVTATRAALVPVTLAGEELAMAQALAGVSTDSVAACNGQSFRENILFTHRGLSGPAILQISSYWESGDALELDLLPGEEAGAWLRERKKARPEARLRTILGERLPNRLVEQIQGKWFQNRPMQHCTDRDLEALGDRLGAWRIRPSGTEGYRTAEVTLGGVDTDELSSRTMEARKVPGLYFIGEVVDVTGWLGGYNFQWAWASGFAAGQAA